MSNTIAGGRYITAAGVLVNANGEPIATAEKLQSDDLSSIRGIGTERQNELEALGISTFEQLANADIDGLVRDMEVSKKTIAGWQRKAAEEL